MNALHTLILHLIALNQTAIEAFADGKLSLGERLSLASKAAPVAFTNWRAVVSTYRAMNGQQLAELHAAIAEELDMTNEKAEAITKAVLKIASALAELQKAIKG